MILVVGQLLRGLGNADDFVELQERLHFLPRNLGEYYERAFNQIDEFYTEDTAQILQLISAARRPLSMVTLTIYELGKRVNYPFAKKLHTLTNAELDVAHDMCRHHLQSRCQDFVSVKNQSKHWLNPRYTVDFLHSTVTEFLGTASMKTRLAASSGQNFNARRCLLETTLAQINLINFRPRWGPNRRKNQVKKLIEQFVGYIRDSELLEGVSHSALLENFDRVIQKHIDMVEPLCGHWANSSYFDRGTAMQIDYSKNQASNLLVFSIQEDLQLYVARKLDNEPHLIKRREGRPLLYYALGDSIQDHRQYYRISSAQLSPRCSARMICLLLQRGAQPHEGISDESILYRMTLGISDRFFRSLYSQDHTPTEYQYHVTSLLLEYAGRSMFNGWYIPLGMMELYPQRLTVLQIIRQVFQPDKAAELEDLIFKSSWYRIQRQWADSPWGSGITVLYFFIVETIRIHNYFARWLSIELYGLVTSFFRKPQEHPNEVPNDIFDWWPMNFIIAMMITLILVYVLIWLSILFFVSRQFLFVVFRSVSFEYKNDAF